ncbi:transglutaminase domain-containing protein [Blautia sp. SG-772]|nr:transglutaminase domain-containing protein [Blautia sp. SG-772]
MFKIKKDALNLFPSSKRHCFMSCSIHGYSGLSIPDLKKIKKISRICMEINITLLKKMGYYAATAAEAFRAYGIPTRYVEGYYLSGDDIHSEASGINKLTGADAHAWVEVYFDGVGWLSLDVTPGYYYDAVSLQQMIGMPEQASKNAALEDPSFEANQVASGYSLTGDSGDRKNPGL